jgi:hypothetical protein
MKLDNSYWYDQVEIYGILNSLQVQTNNFFYLPIPSFNIGLEASAKEAAKKIQSILQNKPLIDSLPNNFYLISPVYVGGNHWNLLVLDPKTREGRILDFSSLNYQKYREEYIAAFNKIEKTVKLSEARMSIYQDGSFCGPSICLAAELIATYQPNLADINQQWFLDKLKENERKLFSDEELKKGIHMLERNLLTDNAKLHVRHLQADMYDYSNRVLQQINGIDETFVNNTIVEVDEKDLLKAQGLSQTLDGVLRALPMARYYWSRLNEGHRDGFYDSLREYVNSVPAEAIQKDRIRNELNQFILATFAARVADSKQEPANAFKKCKLQQNQIDAFKEHLEAVIKSENIVVNRKEIINEFSRLYCENEAYNQFQTFLNKKGVNIGTAFVSDYLFPQIYSKVASLTCQGIQREREEVLSSSLKNAAPAKNKSVANSKAEVKAPINQPAQPVVQPKHAVPAASADKKPEVKKNEAVNNNNVPASLDLTLDEPKLEELLIKYQEGTKELKDFKEKLSRSYKEDSYAIKFFKDFKINKCDIEKMDENEKKALQAQLEEIENFKTRNNKK